MGFTHQGKRIAVVGGGIAGLGLALSLHQRGIACDVYEAVPEVKELGVGITLLPHAMRELAALGVQPQLEAAGIENLESVFFNRWGQFIYREPRGRHAGYPVPEVGIHRGRLHRILYEHAQSVIGEGRIHTDHRCVGVDQDASGATIRFTDAQGNARPPVRADVVGLRLEVAPGDVVECHVPPYEADFRVELLRPGGPTPPQ